MNRNYKLPLKTRLEIGERIQRLRLSCGYLTNTSFAKKLGLASNTVFDWQTGRISPSVYTLFRLTALFDCPVSQILPKDISLEGYKPKKQSRVSQNRVQNRSKYQAKNGPKKNKPNGAFKNDRRQSRHP